MSEKKKLGIFGKKKATPKGARKVLPTIQVSDPPAPAFAPPTPPVATKTQSNGPPASAPPRPPKPMSSAEPSPVSRRPAPPPTRQGRSATVCFGDTADGDGLPDLIPVVSATPPPVPAKPPVPTKPKPTGGAFEGVEGNPAVSAPVPSAGAGDDSGVSAALDVAAPSGTTWKRGAEAEAIMKLLQMEAMKMTGQSGRDSMRTIEVQRPPTPPKQEDVLIIEVPDELVKPEQLEKTFDQELTAGVLAVLEDQLAWFNESWAAESKEGKNAARAALQSHIWDQLAAKGVAVEAQLKNLSVLLEDDQFDALTMVRMELEPTTRKLVKVLATAGGHLATSDCSPLDYSGPVAAVVKVLGDVLDVITAPVRTIKQLSYVNAIAQTVQSSLTKLDVEGSPVESTLGAAASYRTPTHIHNVVSGNLERLTQRLQVLFVQLTNTIDGIDGETGILLHRKLLDVLANVRVTSQTLQQAVHELATARRLCEIGSSSKGTEEVAAPQQAKGKKAEDQTLWTCVAPGASPPSDKEKGTLDELVWMLTSTTMMDNDFIHTFIITYGSFTTAEVLFAKLMERYNVPKKQRCKPNEDKKQVQLRVCIALKYWIEHKGSELEDNVLSDLTDFIDNQLVQDGQSNLSGLLRNALNQATSQEAKASKVIKFDLATLACTYSQTDMFMSTPVKEIAEQLTLISWQIFSRVGSSELLNQCWNKPKAHHRAPNVRQMITRFNDVSYWVTYMITAQEKVAVRSQIMNKMIKLASLLFEMQNFDGLMGIIAGLQQSSNSRLKHTKAMLKPELAEEFEKLNAMMQPQQSWKFYRDHLRSIHPPAIPYMGVYLTDLTFIEDGNPDTRMDGTGRSLINFKKREMVHKVIQEVEDLQSIDAGASFDTLEVSEPLFSYLKELPMLDENQAYSLSLEREPRNSPKEAIL